MRPLLRWAGSKKQLLGSLRPYWVQSSAARYVEPFSGSAALFFDLEPQRALLSDANETLIEFYASLKTHASLVYELSSSWKADKATFYRVRDDFRNEKDSLRRSAMFFYLNRNCFNGIFRTNLAGEFNVPFSGNKTGAMPSWSEVEQAVSLLKRAAIHSGDFKKLVRDHVDRDDFVYLDPPYAVENRRVFVQYNSNTFGIEDLNQVADLLHCIDALGAKFVLSYAVCREALQLFKHWPMRRVICQRNVSGFSAHRRKAQELVITNIS